MTHEQAQDISDERLGEIWRMPENYMRPISFARAVLALQPDTTPAAKEEAEAFVRDLLWNDHPECCGSPVVGAEYMGAQEMVCCGCPEPALLNEAQIVASLRARFPDAIRLLGEDAGRGES